MKRIVIKIGTNVITKENGLIDEKNVSELTRQIAQLKKRGVEIILVSSGAMGAGKPLIKLDKKTGDVVKRQVFASVGQIELMKTYSELFEKHNQTCAQILATKEDFRDRMHYLNMKNCLEALLSHEVIPIINENDAISVNELMFTDNDELAGLIASMMNIDDVILLSSVDGVLDQSCTKVISQIDSNTKIEQCIRPEKSTFGRGGMLTKAKIARKLSSMGITTHIANGEKKNILIDIATGKKRGTKFVAQKEKASSLKRWIAHSEGYEKGLVKIDNGAKKALRSKISSLLPVGITKVEGDFKKGDIVKIKDLGFGIAAYSSKTLKKYMGKKNKKAFIHYDYLFLNEEKICS